MGAIGEIQEIKTGRKKQRRDYTRGILNREKRKERGRVGKERGHMKINSD